MKEHLITTKNSDGSVIPNVTDSTSWGSLNTSAGGHYDNDGQY